MAYKEIVTKAVIGKGKKKYKDTYQIEVEHEPTTVLGCWIINHNFQAKEINDKISIDGSFDANVWYSYDNDTKTTVSTKTFEYEELLKLRIKDYDALTNDNEIIVRSLKQPTVQNVSINNGEVNLSVSKELGVEIITEDDFIERFMKK